AFALAATFHLEVLTPNRKELDEQVVSIVVPGELGYLGVMANHAPLITTLSTGDLKITLDGNEEKYFQIKGGILKVARNEATLLTESITKIEA
ncbi:MAG: ATP synthase F1 subunit epsilon, partial [Candidatus Latescibacterota bacterium]